MQKIITILSTMLILSIPATGISAQDDASTLEGLVSAYERSYAYDPEVLTQANEDADGGYDFAMMMSGIEILGYTFESSGHANQFVDEIMGGLLALGDDNPDTFGHIQVDELEGFDTDGIRVTIANEDSDVMVSTIMIVQDSHVFEVSVRDIEIEAAESKADEILQFILDAESQSEEVSFDQNGTSSGGVFDYMPTAEHDVIGDFTVVRDSELDAEYFG